MKCDLYNLALGIFDKISVKSPVILNKKIEIYKKYGDYLYSIGDFENSITKYILTIGNLEPSYVIRKVLFHFTQTNHTVI